jgi:hypothetical protein
VVEANNSTGIDQDVPAELKDIAGYRTQASPADKQLDICPPGRRPPDVPKPSPLHPVGAVEVPRFVNQYWPVQAGVTNIALRDRTTLERDDSDLDAEFT